MLSTNNTTSSVNNNKPIPKYEGPIVGSQAYSDIYSQESPSFDYSGDYGLVEEKFMPYSFNINSNNDSYFQGLQQTMMDFGWRLNEDDNGNMYFTHPTYNGAEYPVYTRYLENGKTVSLPLINREDDPKGLGCTIIVYPGSSYSRVETNEWSSYWDNRNGRRRARYLNYLSNREKKRDEFIKMAKTDPSIKVWNKNTPRCDPLTWQYNNQLPNQHEEIF